jgi:Peptidase_C39 like family
VKPTLPLKPDDAVRTASTMAKADRLGEGGRWLDVPRLAQFNGQTQSWLWCGRAAAAMVYAYYCKASGKTSEYVGHKTGEPGPGPNGKLKDNLRFLGGSHADAIAGITAAGRCAPAQIFEGAGWKHTEGYLQRSAKEPIETDRASVERRFAPLLDALRRNNPAVLYTRLSTSKNGGHIVCVSGFKKVDGELWLRINDPTSPHDDLLGRNNWTLVQRHPSSFSEYWVRASRLLEEHPQKPGKRLLSYMEHDKIGRYLVVSDQTVKDDAEVVHVLEATPAAKDDKEAKPPAAPAAGGTSLPFEVNRSASVSAESLLALYHSSEHGAGGYFPLADSTAFHCGAHFLVDHRTKVRAIARSEVVAARLSVEPGEHPWGDTGFVLLRHLLDGGKALYSLLLHLEREPLHPDRACGWLSRLLISAMGGTEAKKPKWRVTEEVATWKDADRGRFSPVNADPKTTVKPGIYEEKDRLSEDHALYVKLDGGWIRASLQDGEGAARELSPWADFDLDVAAKNSAQVKALRDGKVAVLDVDKQDGKHRWTVESGEVVGIAGTYLGMPQFHWSVFSKDPVLPTGSLPKQEYGAKDEVKLASLDLTAHDAGTIEQVQQLLQALDPDKQHLAKVAPGGILVSGDLTSFYRAPTNCWRSRYQAAKGRCEFKLDVDKMIALERYKSHTDAERNEFKKNVKAFLFWDELSSADDFPKDGVAVWVHPVTALRLMAHVRLEEDKDDPPAKPDEGALRPQDDLVLLLRDAKGPLAEVEVTVKSRGEVLVKERTDSQGELLLPFRKLTGKDVEISIAQDAVGDKGQLVAVLNESGAARTLLPGTAPADQAFNGTDLLPEVRLGLAMRVRKGQSPGIFEEWKERSFKLQKRVRALPEGTQLTVERIVYRKDDGKLEAVQTHVDGDPVYLWSIWEGEHNLEPDPGAPASPDAQQGPSVQASWSARVAHLNDHPVFAGRVAGIDDGAELEVRFFAILATGAPEHDVELHAEKVKVAAGGFSVAFDPHQLVADHDLLNTTRPVYAKVKSGDREFSLRDQAIAVYPEGRIQDAPPPPPEGVAEGAQVVYAFTEIDRGGTVDRHHTKDGKEPQTRKAAQLSGEVARRIASDGGDELYVGGVVREMHLATEAQEHLTAAQALEQQKAALLAIYPDAPVKDLFSKPEEAFFRDNGMTVGVCAQDCKKEVCEAGKTTGCTEEIRTRNLRSCQNVKADPSVAADKGRNLCRTAVPDPAKLPVVAVHCYSALGVCNSVRHDKSKCFLQTVVRGKDNEERERWYVSLTQRAKSGDQTVYPYHGGHSGAPAQVARGVNLRVVVVNPQNGNAVVCSMEDYGPSGNTRAKEGNDAVPDAQIERDGLVGWGHICGLSYEAHWKLDFKGRHGDHVALLAYVPASTPLGPLGPNAVIKLRKRATYAQIMALEAVPEKAST